MPEGISFLQELRRETEADCLARMKPQRIQEIM